VAFGDVGLTTAQRFHLGAGELDAGLVGIAEMVLAPRLAVFGDALAAVVLVGRRHRRHPPDLHERATTRRPWPGSQDRRRRALDRPGAWTLPQSAPAAGGARPNTARAWKLHTSPVPAKSRRTAPRAGPSSGR